MKKILSLALVCLFILGILTGCGAKTTGAPEKTEEELRAEIKAELEAEAKAKAEAQSQAEVETEAEAQAEEKPKSENQNTGEAAANEDEQDNKEVKEKNAEVKEQESDSSKTGLIYTNNKDYWEYKQNTKVPVDLDGDGKNEEVMFDTNKGRLYINSYFRELDMMSVDNSSFVIIDYKDKYHEQGVLGKFIAIKDFGPSADFTTTFYVYWLEVDGIKSDNPIFSVGTIGGLISRSDTYDKNNPDDFNDKLIMTEEGIYAPVRMNMVHTWWGRNLFTYYSTYKSMIDNINKYERDYDTDGGNNTLLQKDKNLYFSEKDMDSSSIIVKGNQNVKMIKTDGESWVYMVADDGSEGWVPVETIKEPRYEGFKFYD